MNEYVMVGTKAEGVVGFAVYNHYGLSAVKIRKSRIVQIEKSNNIMAGETGTVRHISARTLAKILLKHSVFADATVLDGRPATLVKMLKVSLPPVRSLLIT